MPGTGGVAARLGRARRDAASCGDRPARGGMAGGLTGDDGEADSAERSYGGGRPADEDQEGHDEQGDLDAAADGHADGLPLYAAVTAVTCSAALPTMGRINNT